MFVIDTATAQNGKVKGNYVSIHSSGFRDFLLKPEVLRSIVECGFEHPSEVQHECIPQVRKTIYKGLTSLARRIIQLLTSKMEIVYCKPPP